LTGIYSEHQRFGELPVLQLLVSDFEGAITELLAGNVLSNLKSRQYTVILGENVKVTYNPMEREFSVEGGTQNMLQYKFEMNYQSFRKQRDSIYKVYSQSSLSAGAKAEATSIAARSLFSQNLLDNTKLIKANPDSPVALRNFSPVIYDQRTSAETVEKYSMVFQKRLKALNTAKMYTKMYLTSPKWNYYQRSQQ